MSDPEITNERRASTALSAINAYARMSPFESLPDTNFFFDFEREPEERAGDQDRLSGLLCGLMHYTERRKLSFTDALADARRQYNRQRTSYLPGDAVQRAGPARRAAAAGGAPLTGEIVKARPGGPPVYEVDFVTSREWVQEPDLAPAQPFPATATGYGDEICSAYVARYCMVKAIRRIEAAAGTGSGPDPADAQELDIFLTALCRWSGLERPAVLRSFSTVLTEKDGHLLVAAPPGTHPVTLAAADAPSPPDATQPSAARVAATGTAATPPRPTAGQPHKRSRR